MNWNKHIQDAEERARKKTQAELECLSHMNWRADQKMLLMIHRMVILSTLRYSETAITEE
jgi:hypothetical protein